MINTINVEELINYDIDDESLRYILKGMYFGLEDDNFLNNLCKKLKINLTGKGLDEYLRSLDYVIYYAKYSKFNNCYNELTNSLSGEVTPKVIERSLTILSLYDIEVYRKKYDLINSPYFRYLLIKKPRENAVLANLRLPRYLDDIKYFLERYKLVGLEDFIRTIKEDGTKDVHVTLFLLVYYLSLLYKEGIRFKIFSSDEPSFWIVITLENLDKLTEVRRELLKEFPEYEDEIYEIQGMVVE
ncbi:hypothetical protein [Acidianus sp. HS-5]|uniref:hypothetical protein n=1 Tax=Acidianus sp. HS-5 TaxID=2886040 RepID=UPI001F386F39|nr:hypothetical protein [Acidianus sp. HS-5]BDC17444.1 hypothetical protein HS5_03340 [Acidianus sp. HS-5]